MTRAVVLGGGGPVGIGWEAGLLVGLARNGVDIAAADRIVGTSAGSVVGFTLASGGDLTEAKELVNRASEGGPLAGDSDPAKAAQDLEILLATVADAAAHPDEAEEIRSRLGKMALAASTVDEDRWLAGFADFAGADWPEGFACTAVDTATGRFKVWETDSAVDAQLAIASSCAVPCVFPPVTINGKRWMDGGLRDMLNADVAAGAGTVLVVSCTVLEVPEGFAIPGLDAMLGATRAQLDMLRDGGSEVECVVPGSEMLEISGWGMNLMDFASTGAAYEAGLRQGQAEASRLAGFWTS
ncbi:MAG TPA: patatin-like phospholipase family protein [Acidimicrobiales bacterium]|nr:patatin-like phospholipase family protein [Acidimicrobiales bacterium]